ncbi:putative baseplate hub and lysozyme [Erwinia phage pEa_SNUABM_5]|uniref:Putative baseplate hub and lysozyme n=1 Tax=Erwinia phage pEa_SNUABM_5 TaxID=2797313 RepID=A0A7T8IVV4_9CAUD|nr:putative baseplate hub and lysozyme [Erwinia phage pEa_SNUABM_5]QQO90273.1 putative baseplate hub and lysozyme [Erwinia phage pEa_SNUABM_5]
MIPLNDNVSKKGIDRFMDYEGVVIDNNDPQRISQVKVRIKGLMDDVEDENLPWLRPHIRHLEGYLGGSQVNAFGMFSVPVRGSRVTVNFPTGELYEGQYSGHARPTEAEQLPASLINYPHRIVIQLSTGTQMIIDRKTRETFLILSGDYNQTIFGDVTQTIVGNQSLVVTGNKSDIPDYILNDPAMTAGKLKASPAKRIKFLGKAKGDAGNQYLHVKGNQTVIVEGDRHVTVNGRDTLKVKRDIETTAGGEIKANGQVINLN